ncbi:hypothetical protein [Leucobacter sp. UCD-THU]|uniref:hypothetical protein n=1 Tax=Leucobacter sp. UCD-THU TaxID=1292023 RepID=UPI00037A9F56|nr:hypothetical protein [Leucobacter sp. UCD-THU]
MTENTDRSRRFADALISEIKAEMGRRDLSSRGLGRLIDKSSQYMSTRLDGGNPRTGERVPLGVGDLAAIADALGLSLTDLVERAERAASAPLAAPVSLAERRANVSGTSEDEPDIPENVLDEWAGRYAAHPDDGEPEDHTP